MGQGTRVAAPCLARKRHRPAESPVRNPNAVRTLDDTQLEQFDGEYVRDDVWQQIHPSIAAAFPDGRFTFLDIGGGNGRFADRMLAAFPECVGTVLDTSQLLLDRNTPNPRKSLLLESAQNIGALGRRFDVACLHMVLHHLIGETYAETRANMITQLRATGDVLTDRGRLSIYENLYDGWWIDNAPGRIIYSLTSSRRLRSVIGRLGANTAGVGVCFLSEAEWRSTITGSGLRVESEFASKPRDIPKAWNVFLHVRSVRRGHFWVSR